MLKAVHDGLLEKSVLVAYTVAVQRYIMSRRRIQKTSRKSAETAVAQCRIFDIFKLGNASAVSFQRFINHLCQPQTQQIVVHSPAHQEFHRQIHSSSARHMLFGALLPLLGDILHYNTGYAVMQLPYRGILRRYTETAGKFAFKRAPEIICVHFYLPLSEIFSFILYPFSRYIPRRYFQTVLLVYRDVQSLHLSCKRSRKMPPASRGYEKSSAHIYSLRKS